MVIKADCAPIISSWCRVLLPIWASVLCQVASIWNASGQSRMELETWFLIFDEWWCCLLSWEYRKCDCEFQSGGCLPWVIVPSCMSSVRHHFQTQVKCCQAVTECKSIVTFICCAVVKWLLIHFNCSHRHRCVSQGLKRGPGGKMCVLFLTWSGLP